MTTLVSPTAYPPFTGGVTAYYRDNVKVAFSLSIGNDAYYFANSDEFNRLKPDAYVVSDFRVMDLGFNYAYENSDIITEQQLAVVIFDRNTRITSGYFIVRPWFPATSLDPFVILATYPSSKDVW
jgi:hypothetical protein